MTRPFSLTMQAQRLDLHRFWLIILVGSILLTIAWLRWALTSQVSIYETSTSVELTPKVAKDKATDPKKNKPSAQGAQERRIEARFPASARESLKPGQEAVVFVREGSREQTVPAVISEVSDDADKKQIRVVLRADADTQKGAVDPLASAPPDRVRVLAGTRTPLELWLPELAPHNKSTAEDRPKIAQ